MRGRALVEALWRRATRAGLWVKPGHFYSPLVDPEAVRARRDRIFSAPPSPEALAGIDLDAPGQLARLAELAPLLADQPFPRRAAPGFRYRFENPFYSYSDGLFLQALLRSLRPRRYLEVGSGFSSALALDVRDRFLPELALTFVEPHPERLRALLRPGDEARITLHRAPLQEAPRAPFDELRENDVLLIDSTHVLKTDSDVAHLLFEILPRLAPGVHVHLHDLFYPFEYPEAWVLEGRGWNEAYAVRAFLQFNAAFRVVLWNHFLALAHPRALAAAAPLALENPGGSLWLRRA